ncbi:hypothetical protein AOQ73_18120 [Bradyrhizobium pachyrhizi]|uniref:hypothetical protein n=1 Tax=Bradyrhizobium pachyrhizi TaxID=280333 RepID=UPI000704F5E7|nr:hypothetical protein [Bradyrhizobium pachyrhizi]KRQ01271.1 hypothetical protein AOQ73_18120 [Bradyrhizobium pachyrhizi]
MSANKSAIVRAVRWLEKFQEGEYARLGVTPTMFGEMLDVDSLHNQFDQNTVNQFNDILSQFPGSKYDSPVLRFDLCKILHYVRAKDPRPAKPSLVVGESPSLIPNAHVALGREVSVIVHNTGIAIFFTFAVVALARLIELPSPISSATLDQLRQSRSELKHDWLGDATALMLKAMIIAATGNLPGANDVIEWYFKIPGERVSIWKAELANVSPILDSIKAFVMSHEYAHANPQQWEHEGFGDDKDLQLALRLLADNAASEFDADTIGAQLALNYNAHAGNGPEYSCLGMLLFFDLMRLQRRAIDTICGVGSRNEQAVDSFTHPPLITRRNRVASEIKRLHGLPSYTERGFAIIDTYNVAIELIWESVQPYLEHLHKSGLAARVAPECKVGNLIDDLKRLIGPDDET